MVYNKGLRGNSQLIKRLGIITYRICVNKISFDSRKCSYFLAKINTGKISISNREPQSNRKDFSLDKKPNFYNLI